MINGPAPRASFPAFRLAAAVFLGLVAAMIAPPARAQAAGFNTGAGTNDFVFHVAGQTDGRILIGGRFTTYNGVARSGLARLNADGSLDTSFDPGSGTVGSVYHVEEEANGQIYIAGDFTSYNGVARSGVARLNADGSLDTSFDPGTGADGKVVFGLGVQVDGRVIVGGRFTTFNGVARVGVARLNADGTLDGTFDPGAGAAGNSGNGTNGVYDVLVQPDGRVLLGGYFNQYDGVVQPGLVRVNTDGSPDMGFVTGNGVGRGNYVQSLALQADGKIVAGGNFTRFANAAAGGVVRLNVDGSTDTTFSVGAGAAGRTDVVYAVVVDTGGRILAGGDFATFNTVASAGIVRLNGDGSVDPSFNANGGVNTSYVDSLALPVFGGVLLGGNFTAVGGTASPGLALLDPNGVNESGDVVTLASNLPKIGHDQSSNVATVTLTRTGNITQALEVFYTTAGAAVSGVDYQPLSGHRTIKAGAASVSFSVIAEEPADVTGTFPVKIVLSAGTNYTVGSVPPFAKIKIVH